MKMGKPASFLLAVLLAACALPLPAWGFHVCLYGSDPPCSIWIGETMCGTATPAWRLISRIKAPIYDHSCCIRCATPEERIEDMVKTLYTLPDEYHLDEKNRGNLFWGHAGENTAEALHAWEAHDRGRFHAEDFAPGVLEELTTLQDGFASSSIIDLGILGPRYSRYYINRDFPVGLEKMLRWAGDASLSCSAVQSAPQEDGSWGFAAHVLLTAQDGTQTAFNISGTAYFNEDGKFTAIHIPDDGGLSEFLEDELIWPAPNKIIVAHSGPTPGPPSPMP